MKKRYIAVTIVLLIIIGILIIKIISDKDDSIQNKIVEDIDKFQKDKENELKNITEDNFLGWWNSDSISAKVEQHKIVFYSSEISFKKVNDNTIIYSSTEYTNKEGNGMFGTFTNEKMPEVYIKIDKEESGFSFEIKQGVAIDKYNYEKIGYVDNNKVFYFLNPSKYIKTIEDINFKNGKFYMDNEIIIEKENAATKILGDIKIKGLDYKRMNIFDE